MTDKQKKHEIISYFLGLMILDLKKNPELSLLLADGTEITRKELISFIVELEDNDQVNIPKNPKYDFKVKEK